MGWVENDRLEIARGCVDRAERYISRKGGLFG